MKSTRFAATAVLVVSFGSLADAQFLMMPDAVEDRLVLFDANTGALVNPSYIRLPLSSSSDPVQAMQVGFEIWLSGAYSDRIVRYDLEGRPQGTVGGGIDRTFGMGLVANTVYVINSGTSNGAPGLGVVTFDTAGNRTGSWATPNSPFAIGILPFGGGLLISSSANDDIHRYSFTGTPLGTFHNSASLSFSQQMAYAANGDVLVASFATDNVARLNPTTGEIISTFAAPSATGVWQLGNGNFMWTSPAGAFVHDIGTGVNTLVYSGNGGFIDFLQVPAPSVAGSFAVCAIASTRRRR